MSSMIQQPDPTMMTSASNPTTISNNANIGGIIVAKGHSGISQYIPTSTLQRQYNEYTPNGITLFIQTNSNCCLSGGLEQLFQMQRNNNTTNPSSTSLPSTNTTGSQNDVTNNSTKKTKNDNPFSFLEEDDDDDDDEADGGTATTTNADTTANIMSVPYDDGTKQRNNKKMMGGIFSIATKVAKKSMKSLERNMQSLAVKADSHNNTPDDLIIALYYVDKNNVEYILYASEQQQCTTDTGVQFIIPFNISDYIIYNQYPVIMKLYMKKGSSQKSSTFSSAMMMLSSNKYHLIGITSLNAVAIQQQLLQQQSQLQQQNVMKQNYLYYTLPLNSPYIVNGLLYITAMLNYKYPVLCNKGWTLSDSNPIMIPNTTSSLYNMPLHQSYSFPTNINNASITPKLTYIVIERSIESTIVLPIATAITQLSYISCQKSLQHSLSIHKMLLNYRHDIPSSIDSPYIDTNINISHLILLNNNNTNINATISAYWQRPNSIFEIEILSTQRIPVIIDPMNMNSMNQTINFTFYPKPLRTGILPSILQSYGKNVPNFFLGTIRFQINIANTNTVSVSMTESTGNQNPFDSFSFNNNSSQPLPIQQLQDTILECYIPLEQIFQEQSSSLPIAPGTLRPTIMKSYPVTGNQSAVVVGTILMGMNMELKQGATVNNESAIIPADGGLIQFMNLDTSLLLDGGLLPALDFDELAINTTSSEDQRRRNQLRTMGQFITHSYLEQHINFVRKQDTEFFQQRYNQYMMSIQNALVVNSSTTLPLASPTEIHLDHRPKVFRPSSSRPDMLLSAIPFNVHTATLTIDYAIDPTSAPPTPPISLPPDDSLNTIFCNITCGAPCDHARGFYNVFGMKKDSTTPTQTIGLNSPVGVASGGLRRLEQKRIELIQEISNLQTHLIMSIGNYFMEQRNTNTTSNSNKNHIPARHMELQALRYKVYEAVQCLHHLTWTCAVRRSSVFSQALGIAVTSYLATISNTNIVTSLLPNRWIQYGYLICYEGLLSAVGKELGMMEDASIGINMLRMVQIILVSEDDTSTATKSTDYIPIPQSPYLKWIHISRSTTPTTPIPNSNFKMIGNDYIVRIGIMKSYYDQRIPTALKNNVPVRFFPLLFEVGVDIIQWSANKGSNMMKQRNASATSSITSTSSMNLMSPDDPTATTTNDNNNIVEEEDEDTIGVSDQDVLVQLNYEAFQKMNEYAYYVAPPQAGSVVPTGPHPYLATLYQHIVNSSGKMNHDILDEASVLAQQLGGSTAVFCKSGKDRTAMHVTYKQAQFLNKYRTAVMNDNKVNTGSGAGVTLYSTTNNDTNNMIMTDNVSGSGTTNITDMIYSDATILRIYGTRLPICEKNVGQAKYAFNSLQVKFMPDPLKPPMSTLAGFLKGGKVFGGGGIET